MTGAAVQRLGWSVLLGGLVYAAAATRPAPAIGQLGGNGAASFSCQEGRSDDCDTRLPGLGEAGGVPVSLGRGPAGLRGGPLDLLALSPPRDCSAGDFTAAEIEQLMCEFMARYEQVKDEGVADEDGLQWPEAQTCGDEENPVPDKPAEGTYASQMSNPEQAVELVRAVVEAFYNPETRIYDHFKDPETDETYPVDLGSGLDHPDFPADWAAGNESPTGPDATAWDAVGTDNYAEVARTMLEYIMRLDWDQLDRDMTSETGCPGCPLTLDITAPDLGYAGCDSGQCVDGEGALYDVHVDGISARFGLGRLDSDSNAGYLKLPSATPPDPSIYTPADLELVLHSEIRTSGTNVIRLAPAETGTVGVLRQVWTGNRLIDVVTSAEDEEVGADTYELRYYRQDQTTGTQDGAYLWGIKTGAVPYRTVVVDKPAGTTDNSNLRVTERDELGTAAYVAQYVWDAATGWSLTKGLDTGVPDPPLDSGVLRESFVETVEGDDRIQTRKVLSADGLTVYSHVEETYTRYGFGSRLTRRVVDPGGAALTSTWEYDDDAAEGDGSYGKLRLMTTEAGSWEYYEYNADGALLRTIMQLGDNAYNAPADADAIDDLANANQAVAYTSAYQEPHFHTSEGEFHVKARTHRVLGEVMEKSYEISLGIVRLADLYEVLQVRSATTTAPEEGPTLVGFANNIIDGSNPAGHLVSRTWRYNGVLGANLNPSKTARSLSPDGQMTLYGYPADGVTVVERGYVVNPAAEAPVMAYGTRTTRTTHATTGNFVSTHVERIVDDRGYFTVSFTEAGDTDDFGRPTQMLYYFGAAAQARSTGDDTAAASYSTSRAYAGCCGAAGMTSTTDRFGVVTESHVDDLGRAYKTVNASGTTDAQIVSLREFDAMGRVFQSGIDGDGDDVLTRGGLDTVTTVAYDTAGRMVSSQDPEGRMSYRTYRRVKADGTAFDPGTDTGVFYWENRDYGHDAGAPVRVTWTGSQGAVVLQAVCSTAAAWDATAPPTGDEALTVQRQTVQEDEWVVLDGTGFAYTQRERSTHAYHDLTGVTWLSAPGAPGTHYLVVSKTEMDPLGRVSRSTDALGNLTEPVFEPGTGRTVGTRVGVDPASLHTVSRMFYREFAAGDDANNPTGAQRPYATRSYSVRPGLDAAPVEDAGMSDYVYAETTEAYTLIGAVDALALESMTTWSRPSAAGAPRSSRTTDAQGRVTQQSVYRNDDSAHLLSQSRTAYYPEDPADPGYLAASAGRVRYTDVMEAGEAGGLTGHFLRTESFYDDAGRPVKTQTHGRGFTKTQYDGYGRVLRQVFASGEGDTPDTYGANAFAGDTVLSETVNTYNLAGEVIQTTSYERAHDASATGLLSEAAAPQSRVSYSAVWQDMHGRPTHQAFYGTHGGSPFTRPASPPEPDSSPGVPPGVLVSKTAYDAAGVAYLTTAPDGTQARTYTDTAGNRTHVVEGYDPAGFTDSEDPATLTGPRVSDVNRVTRYTYDYTAPSAGGSGGAGQLVEITAVDPDADLTTDDDQTTSYIHSGELDAAGRGWVPVNGRPVAVLYPDALEAGATRASVIADLDAGTHGDFVATTYYAGGDMKGVTDQRGVAWTQTYTDAGYLGSRRASAPVGVVPAGSDLRYDYTYGDAGEVLTVTAYSAPGAPGTPEAPPASEDQTSSVAYTYDGFYNPTSETQGHHLTAQGVASEQAGAVGFGYDQTHTGAGTAYTHAYRPNQVTYPNGRQVELVYDGHDGIDSAISRANGIDEVIYDFSGTPVSTPVTRYTYLGSGTLVRKDLPGPGVRLDMIDEGSEGAEADDPYDASYDRLGRMVRTQWERYDFSSGDGAEDIFLMEHGYNPVGRQTYDRRHVYTNDSTVSRLDGLHRITGYDRGPIVLDALGEVDLTAGVSGGGAIDDFWIVNGRDWHLDQLGNPVSVDTESSTARFGVATNAANEITTRTLDATEPTDYTRTYFSNASDKDIFTQAVGCDLTTDVTVDNGNDNDNDLVINAGSPTVPALILTGEGRGPIPFATSVSSPGATGVVGVVFGYKSELDYWVLGINFTAGNGDWEIYHVHDDDGDGSIDHASPAEKELVSSANYNHSDLDTWYSLYARTNPNTVDIFRDAFDLSAAGGFPSGRYGFYTEVDGAKFRDISFVSDGRVAQPGPAWETEGTNYLVDHNGLGDGKLKTSGSWDKQYRPVLLRHVQAQRFEATFSMQRSSSGNVASGYFVFNYRGPGDYDAIRLRHAPMVVAPEALSVRNGGSASHLIENRDATQIPAPARGRRPAVVPGGIRRGGRAGVRGYLGGRPGDEAGRRPVVYAHDRLDPAVPVRGRHRAARVCRERLHPVLGSCHGQDRRRPQRQPAGLRHLRDDRDRGQLRPDPQQRPIRVRLQLRRVGQPDVRRHAASDVRRE